jgi:CheY-like chemotaxis protein
MGVRQHDATVGSRGETILVVDDDPSVRHIIAMSLESYGYLVLEAESGPAALAMCRSHAGPIQMLLTDVVMPGMNGLGLARQVMELRPEVHPRLPQAFPRNRRLNLPQAEDHQARRQQEIRHGDRAWGAGPGK